MAKQEITQLHEKLDFIHNDNSKEHKEIAVILSKLEEHQRAINGSIVELKKEAYARDVFIRENKSSINKGQGAIMALGIITTIMAIISGIAYYF